MRVTWSQYDASTIPPWTHPDNDSFVSGDLLATGAAGNWDAVASPGADVGSLDDCGSGCDIAPWIEIRDSVRAAAATCGEYRPLYFCPEWVDVSPSRKTPAMTTCGAGSASFRLFPTAMYDRDGDGSHTLVLKAVQTSGTGAPTNAAWVTSITASQTQGQALRVVKVNQTFKIDGADQLVSPSAVSYTLSTSATNFNQGIVSGVPTFIVTEVPGTTDVDFTVSMEWTCATPTDAEEVNPVQGYSFDLSDIGCDVSWPQKFTIRPRPTTNAAFMDVELYGSVAERRSVRLRPVTGGQEFSHEIGGLVLKGKLISHSAQNGASIQFSEVSWDGISLCDAGTYNLPAEE